MPNSEISNNKTKETEKRQGLVFLQIYKEN